MGGLLNTKETSKPKIAWLHNVNSMSTNIIFIVIIIPIISLYSFGFSSSCFHEMWDDYYLYCVCVRVCCGNSSKFPNTVQKRAPYLIESNTILEIEFTVNWANAYISWASINFFFSFFYLWILYGYWLSCFAAVFASCRILKSND